MKWEGLYFFDMVLPFGVRSALFLFDEFSSAVEVIYTLDNFFLATSPPQSKCMAVLFQILHLFAELNITIAPRKSFPVCACLEFMGILLHSNKMEAHLPVDKLTHLQAALGQWANKKSATLQELQSLIGTLQFAPSCNALSISQRVLSSLIGTLASILVSVRTFLCGNIFSKIGVGCLSF